MKKIHLFFITTFSLIVFSFDVNAQAPSPEWVKRYNGSANKMDQPRAMTIDVSGNIYVTGPSEIGKKANTDFATVKYSPDGTLMWTALYNGASNGGDWPTAIAVDSFGYVYVTGRSTVNTSGVSEFYDYATVKYKPDGTVAWIKTYSSAGNRSDVPQDVQVDVYGNVYVTGSSDMQAGTANSNSIATIKYSSSGGIKWTRVFDFLPNSPDGTGNFNEDGNSIAIDPSGNVYVAGTALIKYDSNGTIIWNDTEDYDRREVLVDASNNIVTTGFSGKTTKYDGTGNVLWQATNVAGFWDMSFDQSGDVFVTGSTSENGSTSDYKTIKYDGATGAQLWSKTFNGSANSTDFSRVIAVDNAGNVYVTGYCSVNNGGRNVGTNYGTVKYSNDGVFQWVALYDSPDKSGSHAFGVVTDEDGNVYVTGQSATKQTSFDFTTIKYAQGTSLKSTVTKISAGNNMLRPGLQTYPNPFAQSTTIDYQLKQDGKVRLSIFDLNGKEIIVLVNNSQTAGNYRMNFAANSLSTGTYVCLLQVGDVVESRKLVVLRR